MLWFKKIKKLFEFEIVHLYQRTKRRIRVMKKSYRMIMIGVLLTVVVAAVICVSIMFKEGSEEITIKPDKQHKQNVDDTPGVGQGYFDAVVLEKYDDHIIVECTEGYQQEVVTGDKLSVSLNTISDEPVPTVQEGDRVRVLYMGEMSKTENGIIKPQDIISLFLIDGDGGIGSFSLGQ